MTSLPKNITYSKRGATLTCPICLKTATYQIGQLDRDEWAKESRSRGHYWCKDCRAKEAYIFDIEREKDDISKLLEMI